MGPATWGSGPVPSAFLFFPHPELTRFLPPLSSPFLCCFLGFLLIFASSCLRILESGKESERESGRESPSRRPRDDDGSAAARLNSSASSVSDQPQQQQRRDGGAADPARLLEMAGYGGGGGRDERRGRGPAHDRSKTWDGSDKGTHRMRIGLDLIVCSLLMLL